MIKKRKYFIFFSVSWSFFVNLSLIIFYVLTCRKHRTNLRRKRTIVLFVSPHLFYIRLFPDLPRKIQGFQEGFSRSRGLDCRISREFNLRSTSLGSISSTSHDVTLQPSVYRQIPKEMLWDTTREIYRDTLRQ